MRCPIRPEVLLSRPVDLRVLVAAVVVAVTASCAAGAGAEPRRAVRLGYFPNLTHAPALVGVERGLFARALGVPVQAAAFNAGPAAVEALFAGAVDAAYLGPTPALNAYVRSGGRAIRVVAGATSGGAALVVAPDVDEPADLRGRRVATPQLGGSQDVALRSWLASHGLRTTLSGGGDVAVLPQPNAQTLETFRSRAVAGAWVPEPWASRLVREEGAKVLVDERDLWPQGRFVTTLLVVRAELLQEEPELVRRLVDAHLDALDLLAADPVGSQEAANTAMARITGTRLPPELLAAAWPALTFTADPLLTSLRTNARHAADLGFLPSADIDGIADLGPLNAALRARSLPQVTR